MESFVHLHTHSDFSGDSIIRVHELAQAAARHGMSAVALTDRRFLHGAVKFGAACRAAGVKPIFGCEVDVLALDPSHGAGQEAGWPRFPLVLLAENEVGWRNLLRLTAKSWRHFPVQYLGRPAGWHRFPVVDVARLAHRCKGIVALSGGGGGEIGALLRMGHVDAAAAVARRFAEIFGMGNFYLELIDPRSGELEISAKTGVPLVATAPCVYLRAGDRALRGIFLRFHELLRGAGATVSCPGGAFRGAKTMRRRFSMVPRALTATMEIAERCIFKDPQAVPHAWFVDLVCTIPPEPAGGTPFPSGDPRLNPRMRQIIGRLIARFGERGVASVPTHLRLQGPGAIFGVGRTMGLPRGLVEQLGGRSLSWPGETITIDEIFRGDHQLAERANRTPGARLWFRIARRLEGLFDGILLSRERLVFGSGDLLDHMALTPDSGRLEGEALWKSQWDMDDLASLGIQRTDLLSSGILPASGEPGMP